MAPQASPDQSSLDEKSADELLEDIADAEEKALELARTNAHLGGRLRFATVPRPTEGEAHTGSAYRQVDPSLHLKEALEETNAAVVNLIVDNAVLTEQRARARARRRVLWLRGLGIGAALILALLFIALGSGSMLGMTLWCGTMGGLGALVYVLSGRIEPKGGSKQSRFLNGGGGGF